MKDDESSKLRPVWPIIPCGPTTQEYEVFSVCYYSEKSELSKILSFKV